MKRAEPPEVRDALLRLSLGYLVGQVPEPMPRRRVLPLLGLLLRASVVVHDGVEGELDAGVQPQEPLHEQERRIRGRFSPRLFEELPDQHELAVRHRIALSSTPTEVRLPRPPSSSLNSARTFAGSLAGEAPTPSHRTGGASAPKRVSLSILRAASSSSCVMNAKRPCLTSHAKSPGAFRVA